MSDPLHLDTKEVVVVRKALKLYHANMPILDPDDEADTTNYLILRADRYLDQKKTERELRDEVG